MELKEGMYVRTKTFTGGKIGKLEKIDNICITDNGAVDKEQIIKASHNIINLIEEGDYVNGMEVMYADWFNEEGDYEEGLAFPMYSSDDLNIIENWQPLKYIKIKSIVTKEQFESMSYVIDKE